MANPITAGTTYAGQFAGKYISAALLSAPTIENGGVTVLPNVKHKEVLQNIATSALLADATCDFDTTQTVTLTEKILEVKDLMVNLQLCRSNFHNTWQSIEMGASAFSDIPKSFEDYLLGYTAAKVAAAMETNIWAGVAGAGSFNGFEALATAQVPAGQIVATAPVTAALVIGQIGSVVDLIPTSVYGNEDLKLYVSSNVARAYVRALGGFAVAATSNAGTNNEGTQWYTNGQLSFDGIPMFVANGMSDDRILAAQTSNLYFGVSLLSDVQEARVIDVSQYDGSDNVRVIMRMSAGVQIGVGADCAYFG
tara:strand:+ start:105 stop:1031 length:927 start_codon:yes stop_codon:yes gene_type:complete